MTDWAGEHAYIERQLRAAAFVRFVTGLATSLLGLLAAVFIYNTNQNAVVAGIAAAGGMITGLIVSRRGRKVLLGVPLVVQGTVQAMDTRTGNVVLDIDAAHALHRGGERVPEPQLQGPRTLSTRPALYAAIDVGQQVCLVCLPNGQAVRQVAPAGGNP